MACDDYHSCASIPLLTAVKFRKINAAHSPAMTLLSQHAERNVIRLELRHNEVLKALDDADREWLEPHMTVFDGSKGDWLLYQGVREMEQYFIIDGILKRVVSNPEGKEMILRFADRNDIETSYAAWRLGTPTPYGIVCVTKVRVIRMPLKEWADFLDERPKAKAAFELYVMRLMSEIMAHTITLHLLDAPGRVHRFVRKHPDLVDRIPQKQLASYLNLSAETLSRLRKSGKI
jgi:CRP/FNR family transcriptional regulator, dissimilatory nitrate respiration regulator